MKIQVTKTVLTLLSTVTFALLASASHAQGDAAAGESKAAVCGSCHGVDGNSSVAANPKLAGQSTRYLIKQMHDIKSGAREVMMMTGILNNVSDQDMADIAAYYSSQEPSFGAAEAELVELGESIYRTGISSLNVAACSACHSPTASGNPQAGFPALSGQHTEYTVKQLKDFRSGARVNDGSTMPMRIVTERLTDKEIEALASYISGLH